MISGDYEVVIVTYHSRSELVGLLSAAPHDQRIVVVDNASGADGTRGVIEGFVNGRWLDGRNSGFAKAANLGARTSDAEYLVFSNPDSRPTPETWDALVDDLRSDPMLALVGAGSVDESGRLELGVGGWEPTLVRTFVYSTGIHRLLPEAGVYARPSRGDSVALEWLGAPCLAIRRELFLELGGFDERYFVYNEDMAFGNTIRGSGFRQRLRTDLHVPHKAASSESEGGTAMFQQRGASMAAYLRHHNGPVSAAVMRGLLAAGSVARAVVAAARGQRILSRKHMAYVVGVVLKRPPDWN